MNRWRRRCDDNRIELAGAFGDRFSDYLRALEANETKAPQASVESAS